jgi:RNA polymerase sigma-70 factor (ECF subfamily)
VGLEPARAEDLTQDVMVAVWRKAASFDRSKAGVSTWIYRIARNRRIDLFRRERTATLDPDEPMLSPEAEALPDAALLAGQQGALIARAMAELPPEQRDMIRAAFYEDLSHSEIAERTGLALGTVKSRMRLAFEKLRVRLESPLHIGFFQGVTWPHDARDDHAGHQPPPGPAPDGSDRVCPSRCARHAGRRRGRGLPRG